MPARPSQLRPLDRRRQWSLRHRGLRDVTKDAQATDLNRLPIARALWRGRVGEGRVQRERRLSAAGECAPRVPLLDEHGLVALHAREVIPAVTVGVRREVVLAHAVRVVDLEDAEVLRRHAAGVAAGQGQHLHGLRAHVPPDVDDGEAASSGSLEGLGRDQGSPAQHLAQRVVRPRRLGELLQAPRAAGERVVPVHDGRRLLHRRPASQRRPRALAARGAEVVVEGHDEAGAGGGSHQLHALRVVSPQDLLLLVKLAVGHGGGAPPQLEALLVERRPSGPRVQPAVAHGDLRRHPRGAPERAVAAASVALRDDPAVGHERPGDGAVLVVEDAPDGEDLSALASPRPCRVRLQRPGPRGAGGHPAAHASASAETEERTRTSRS
mmetsp:Transcript_4282/g.8629  ORF Transcript_4282/g.8629 Transcript_4282/m.8629 type:complete len:382 (+) Transcript_4282:97-1242(+)